MKTMIKWIPMFVIAILLVACGNKDADGDQKKIQVFLDWTPNTNHTGLYVAKEKGFFADEGLDVEIMLPGEVSTEQIIATGKGDFGISFQDQVTQARAENLPIVSIAAINQTHTGGYYTPKSKGIETPKDFEGRVYGAYGSELESASLQAVMDKEGADAGKVDMVQVGNTDYFIALERDLDFVSIFYAWTGIEGEIRGADMNFIPSTEYAEELDTYTPIIITSDEKVEQDPETVQAFINAVSKGYEFAIDTPEEAAEILIKAEPDLDPELVKRSQEWLSPHYQADAPQWGTQELPRWERFANFMIENKIIESVEIEKAFTNEFIANQAK